MISNPFSAKPAGEAQPACPICGGTSFVDYRRRVKARCGKCGALERTRALWMVFKHFGLEKTAGPVLHFAPERAISQALVKAGVKDYRPSDIEIANFPDYPVPVRHFDLTSDPARLEPGSVGGVIHSHVFEHLPCNVYKTFLELNNAIRPGGYHLFIVPYFGQYFSEDLSPLTTDDERTAKFGQFDHVRAFGTRDFDRLFVPAFDGFERVNLAEVFPPEELERQSVPGHSFTRRGGNYVELFIKK